MKRLVVWALFLVAVLSVSSAICFLYGDNTDVFVNEAAMPTVIIDAGHGGEDGGTSSVSGVLEKDINLSIACYLAEMLECAGYDTVMTRTTDEQIGDNSLPTIRQRKISDVRKRLDITKSYPDALLVSIHQNHFSDFRYGGAQVFYSPKSDTSRVLAESVQKSIVNLIQNGNTRKIKKIGTNVYLLYNCENTAIMAECGFLSNASEAENLSSADYQKKMAFSVACGIIKYLEEQNG